MMIHNGVEKYKDLLCQKKLNALVEERNQQLSAMNGKLEIEVKKRTWAIEASNRFMKDLLESDDLNLVLNHMLSYLSKSLNLSIHFVGADVSSVNGKTHFPIFRSERCLGHLVVDKKITNVQQELLEKFFPIVALAVSMSETEQNSDQWVDDLDSLLHRI
jgi:ribosomal protein S19